MQSSISLQYPCDAVKSVVHHHPCDAAESITAAWPLHSLVTLVPLAGDAAQSRPLIWQEHWAQWQQISRPAPVIRGTPPVNYAQLSDPGIVAALFQLY